MNTALLLEDAMRLQQAGRMPEAAQLYSQVLQTDPRNYQALYQLGLMLFEYRKYDDAVRFLDAAYASTQVQLSCSTAAAACCRNWIALKTRSPRMHMR